MRIHSFIKVCIAVITIAFAMTISTVHGSTRMRASPVLTSNITQIRVLCQSPNYGPSCAPYNKIATDRWVQRAQDGNVLNYVEVSRGDNTMSLFNAAPNETVLGTRVDFDFSGMKYSGGSTSRDPTTQTVGGSAFAGGVITGVYEISADNSPETCTQQTTAPGAKCNCDLRSLRPLQGAVGMEEVRKKRDDIVGGTKTRLDLAYDPIKIARGPNGLYVTDHHHGALAWLKAGQKMGTCQIQSDTISTDPTQFWADLNTLKLVRLADKDGKSITATQLPTTLETLPDDPYRTLAWRVRKGDGFCRALMTGNKEFAEFQWADWLRKRAEFKNPPGPNEDWSRRKREVAIELAKDPTKANDPFVQSLPGYRGDKPLAYRCEADPD
jgi:hypothetical protein